MVLFKIKDVQKLRVLIATSGDTQRRFARKIGITPEYFSRIMNEVNTPSAPVANKIAILLGVDVRDLFNVEVIAEPIESEVK